jgi:transposase
MKRDTGKLSARQRLALLIIAGEPTIEGAAEKIGVTRKTVYEWLKQEPFKRALEEARKEYVESGFRTMRLAAKRAAEKIVQHLDCTDEKVSLRAAEDVIEFAKEFISLEDHERRIKELEDRLERAQAEAGASNHLFSRRAKAWR